MRSPIPSASGNPPNRPVKEEPEVTQEESIPSDGKDEVGEEMMKDLGRERAKKEFREYGKDMTDPPPRP